MLLESPKEGCNMARHRHVVVGYLGLVTAVSTTLGGYVACGAQSYRVPIHGNDAQAPSRPNTGQSGMGASTVGLASGANLVGVHSPSGWGKSLPIRFKVTDEMPLPVVEQLRKAMKSWELAIGKPLFVYDGVEKQRGSNFSDLYEPLNDNQNGHYFDFNWALATGKPATVLATTIWENDARDAATIVKADIRYNAEFYLFGDAIKDYSEGKRTIVDMESLALHEVGHLLGLSHINEKEDRYSVMNPSLFIGEGMMTRRLSEGDITRIRSVYGVGDASLAASLEKADDFTGNN
jgi:predicted Zn-dependent protease